MIRQIHISYPIKIKDWTIEKISTVTRSKMYVQMQPEFSWEECRRVNAFRRKIDDQPDLESKVNYAVENSPTTHGTPSTCVISYVGRVDWGELAPYIQGVYTLAFGQVICYHLCWLLECEAKKVKTSDTIRFVGGGALSPVTCQMLADITGRTIETIDHTQEVGAMGAALVVSAGIKGLDVMELSRQLIKPNHTYVPNDQNKAVYERNYRGYRSRSIASSSIRATAYLSIRTA